MHNNELNNGNIACLSLCVIPTKMGNLTVKKRVCRQCVFQQLQEFTLKVILNGRKLKNPIDINR